MPEGFQDRRKYVRIYRNFIISYSLQDKQDVQHDISQVNNISQGGMSFAATAILEAGKTIVVALRTPFLSDVVQLQGTVLESREKIPNLIYDIRLEFKDLTDQAKDALVKIERYSVQGD